jgi:hypothetical protein
MYWEGLTCQVPLSVPRRVRLNMSPVSPCTREMTAMKHLIPIPRDMPACASNNSPNSLGAVHETQPLSQNVAQAPSKDAEDLRIILDRRDTVNLSNTLTVPLARTDNGNQSSAVSSTKLVVLEKILPCGTCKYGMSEETSSVTLCLPMRA